MSLTVKKLEMWINGLYHVKFYFKQDGIIVRDLRGQDMKKFKVLDGNFKGSF